MHKSGLRIQVQILSQLLASCDTHQFEENQKEKVMDLIFHQLRSRFPNIQEQQSATFVRGLFSSLNTHIDFLQHIGDFLISLKEWGGDEAAFAESLTAEQQRVETLAQDRLMVPGLVGPHDPSRVKDDMDDI